MLIYSVTTMLILKNRLKSAWRFEYNIYEADNLKTPFVLGVIRPKIFIPAGLDAEGKRYIIRHEQTHIRRLDHIIKPLAFLILSIHWFNPLVWVAFILMSADMELSCDERVIKEMGGESRKAYSSLLLSLAIGKRVINGSPLAFGEGNVEGRIKNVLNYRKPAFWLTAIVALAVIVVGICLLANPRRNVSHDGNGARGPESYAAVRTTIAPSTAQWLGEQSIGADMATLDYASDDIVIFHGAFGLYVYDLGSRRIVRKWT